MSPLDWRPWPPRSAAFQICNTVRRSTGHPATATSPPANPRGWVAGPSLKQCQMRTRPSYLSSSRGIFTGRDPPRGSRRAGAGVRRASYGYSRLRGAGSFVPTPPGCVAHSRLGPRGVHTPRSVGVAIRPPARSYPAIDPRLCPGRRYPDEIARHRLLRRAGLQGRQDPIGSRPRDIASEVKALRRHTLHKDVFPRRTRTEFRKCVPERDLRQSAGCRWRKIRRTCCVGSRAGPRLGGRGRSMAHVVRSDQGRHCGDDPPVRRVAGPSSGCTTPWGAAGSAGQVCGLACGVAGPCGECV